MDRDTVEHMYRMVDDHVGAEDLNALLKAFIEEKAQEQGSWSSITRCTHEMLGGASPHIDRLAAATELILLCFDIVDDLQDQDHESKPWMQCPPAVALNAVLALLTGFVGELGQCGVTGRSLYEISKMLSRSVSGQHKDVTNQVVSEVDDYLTMIQEKSGSLFRFACLMGYCLTDCSEETMERIDDLADCVGMIHQIQNDLKDIAQFDVKSDLLLRKRTLPVLYLLNVDSEAFRPVKDYYEGKITADALVQDKEQYMRLIVDSGCIEYTKIVQSVCVQKAEELWTVLQVRSPWKEKFRELTYAAFA
ncbi:polyprenyl synthetase family protein [Paenibacillus sp. A3]|uniref:polyprenyl synthetase family protein n=1 Tax=Paenibacillus sp. A3 TaxID=1337054 RepID=UPI000ACE19D3|nr:polyprenyl synthetase family protein [Paenibacillus sp. A3]